MLTTITIPPLLYANFLQIYWQLVVCASFLVPPTTSSSTENTCFLQDRIRTMREFLHKADPEIKEAANGLRCTPKPFEEIMEQTQHDKDRKSVV